ncbi:MAG: hypothetical protein OEZ22_11060 [Spirochaetia bacterium]|nr:hypothetical protein [Spirochaetia bacterium]
MLKKDIRCNVKIINSLTAAIYFVLDNDMDLLLLDLNLNSEDSFKILENRVSLSFQTIIVSKSI